MVIGSVWLAPALVIVMLSTAGYCVGRMIYAWARRRRTDHAVDGAHVAMGVAMAGMLVPSFGTFSAPIWVAVFGIGSVWFAWTAVHSYLANAKAHIEANGRTEKFGSHMGHVLSCVGMVYMFLAMPAAQSAHGTAGMSMTGMAAPGSERFPAIAVVFGFGLLGYACWIVLRLTGLSESVAVAGTSATPAVDRFIRAGDRCGAEFLSPRLAACCDVAMAVVMAYPLIGLA